MYLGLLMITVACATPKKNAMLHAIERSPCNQDNTYSYTKDDVPKPIRLDMVDTTLLSNYSYKDLTIAHAIGVLDILKAYEQKITETRREGTLQHRVELLELRQELNHRIDLASLEISSVTAELDCEEERINQLASFLSDRQAKKETRLTVASLILGSLSALATADLLATKNESDASDYIGVGVGIADATFGVLVLTDNPKVRLLHQRNVLREIWHATETSSVYPPSIWYYLNYNHSASSQQSLREQLLTNWEKFGQIKSKQQVATGENNEIYFSDGGEYTIDELNNRANMYDQIESMIKLMKQDLRNLTLSIDRRKSK